MPWGRWRQYRLVRLGVQPSEIEGMSAVDSEWLLQMDRMAREEGW